MHKVILNYPNDKISRTLILKCLYWAPWIKLTTLSWFISGEVRIECTTPDLIFLSDFTLLNNWVFESLLLILSPQKPLLWFLRPPPTLTGRALAFRVAQQESICEQANYFREILLLSNAKQRNLGKMVSTNSGFMWKRRKHFSQEWHKVPDRRQNSAIPGSEKTLLIEAQKPKQMKALLWSPRVKMIRVVFG